MHSFFVLTAKDPEPLKYTIRNNLFSSNYLDWIERAADFYARYNELMGPLLNAFMVDHHRIDEHVVRVSYSNGATVYVNYGEVAADVDGLRIDAMDYLVHPGEER